MKHLETRANALLSRAGSEGKIMRNTPGLLDAFGKPAESWAFVATETVVLDFSGGRKSKSMDTQGGEVTADRPVATLRADSVLQKQDRIIVNGTEYHVETALNRTSHTTAKLESMNE